MTDSREAPSPPKLRWAGHGHCGPFYLVSDTNEIYGPRDVAIPDKHTRLAVIAEPTDLQAVATEIVQRVRDLEESALRMQRDYTDEVLTASILAVLDRHL